jgi:pyruvate/2-oxoglutarate dehydrogenase complex dihydrolipoamide dehydrogenase (E3) component
MSEEPIKVTVSDPATGEVLGEQVVENDYVVICAGNRYVAHTNAHANGTHVLTIKRDQAAERPSNAGWQGAR